MILLSYQFSFGQTLQYVTNYYKGEKWNKEYVTFERRTLPTTHNSDSWIKQTNEKQ